MLPFNIIVLNPGSTSTKIAYYQNEQCIDRVSFRHTGEELKKYSTVWEQYPMRVALCREWLATHVPSCQGVAAMGGLFRPVQGGAYAVNSQMLDDARKNFQGEHASNLGCALAHEIALHFNTGAFVIDPVSVDEFEPLAYYSGHPAIKRRSLSHALNIHAAARWAENTLHLFRNNSSFIICHLGGGISIAPVKNGKIIDANDASSDGPFSPERTGGLPLQSLITLCYSRKMTEEEMRRFVMGKGGLMAYLGTNSVTDIEKEIELGDATAKEVIEAMAYQISKEIGAMATVLAGAVDAIVLTGGAAHSTLLTQWIEKRVSFLAPVLINAGEYEMQSLAEGTLRILRGTEQVKEY